MSLCFYVIRSFLPSLPVGCRDADLKIKSPPVCMLTKTVDDDKEPSEKTTRETRRHQVLPNHAPAQISNVVQQASPIAAGKQ